MATIVDVANKAGVSISTVSYVLSGVRPVSEKTRRHVLETMDELGYRPHAHARALASRRSNMLALIFPPGSRGLGETELEIVTESVSVMREKGYQMVLWTCGFDDRRELIRLVRQGLVDGMILMEVHEKDRRVEYLSEMDVPCVLIGRTGDSKRHACVDIDFFETFKRAVEHLVEMGHRDIAFVNQSEASWDSGYGPSRQAKRAFEAACEALECKGTHYFCDPAPKDGYALCHRIYSDRKEHSAILVMNDRALSGIVQALERLDRRVPGDVSLLTLLSSSQMATSYLVPLTALEIPAGDLVKRAVDELLSQISMKRDSQKEGQAARAGAGQVPSTLSQELLIPCTLVERSSCAPPPVKPQRTFP